MDERPAFNMRYIWLTTLVSAMGGLLFGYDWVVIGGGDTLFEKIFNLPPPPHGGGASGLASNLSPMYIAEISPASMRGKFVSVNQLTIVIGILAAQLVNWLIAEPVPAGATAADILASWNGQAGWRWVFGAEAGPPFLFFLLMFLIPDNPRW